MSYELIKNSKLKTIFVSFVSLLLKIIFFSASSVSSVVKKLFRNRQSSIVNRQSTMMPGKNKYSIFLVVLFLNVTASFGGDFLLEGGKVIRMEKELRDGEDVFYPIIELLEALGLENYYNPLMSNLF